MTIHYLLLVDTDVGNKNHMEYKKPHEAEHAYSVFMDRAQEEAEITLRDQHGHIKRVHLYLVQSDSQGLSDRHSRKQGGKVILSWEQATDRTSPPISHYVPPSHMTGDGKSCY
jgi:hypothetical protein